MERYEILNRMLEPADQTIRRWIDFLKRNNLYEPFKGGAQDVLKTVLLWNFRKQNKLQVFGEENIPGTGGAVIASNHQSWLDAQVLAVSPSKRRFYFIAKSDFLEWPVLRIMMELNDTLFIKRGGDKDGLNEIAKHIKEGKAVAIFPEGTIPGEEDIPRCNVEPDTGLLPGKTGAVRLALMTGAPIIPVGLTGTGVAFPPEVYPRMEKLQGFGSAPITVRFGKPIHIKQPRGEITHDFLREKTKKLMIEISKLVDHSRNYVPISLPIERKDMPDKLPPMAMKFSPGKSGDGKKHPFGFLVLHGFTSHISCVSGVEEALKEFKLPYRFPILRGHGTRYEDLAGVKASDWYEDAENALLDLYQEADRIVVVGLSMGGLVALDLAGRHQDKVAGLALVAAALEFADPLAMLTPLIAKVVKYWKAPNPYNDKGCAKKNRNYLKFPTDAFASLYYYSKEMKNRLSFVKAPAMIFQSQRDTIVAPKSAKIIYEKISSRDKEIRWFAKSGHEMLLDCEAEQVISEIHEFIKKITYT
ncbi:MAG: alpha/beta fold hydrolase [Deltaproteobacteria bacterium]|nr:alpha/beta fold hydrolase [Deltaproteobacteria bacterium]